jgi:hypothetical protein
VIWPEGEIPTPMITDVELKRATKTLKSNKAPGIDGVPNEILKRVVDLRPGLILDIYNRCVTEASFPTNWKTAKLVLVKKGNKPLEDPSSYRPLCLLNTIANLFEKIMDTRIRDHLE